jgi:hypothetical protein
VAALAHVQHQPCASVAVQGRSTARNR